MMKRTFGVIVAALFGTSAFAVDFQEIKGHLEFSGQLIVRPKPRSTTAVSIIRSQVKTYYHDVGEYVVYVPKGSNESRYATQLLATGQFEFVEPNWRAFAAFNPRDRLFLFQWHHPMIFSSDAWNVTLGDPNLVIGIVDTGIDITHPELSANLVPGYNAIQQLPQSLGGDVSDSGSHGTHVAGCASEITNLEFGLGIAPFCKIMPVRISNDGQTGLMADIHAGARWAADNGAKVVNISFTGFEFSNSERTGQYIRNLGGLLFYAAGNSGNIFSVDPPNIVVVGSSDGNDNPAESSVRGPAIDVFAPGVGIWSTLPNLDFGAYSGTSMASPLAAGIVALIWSVNPDLTPAEAEKILFLSSEDWDNNGNDGLWGWGRVNAFNSVHIAKRGAMAYDPATMRYFEVVTSILNYQYALDAANDRSFEGLSGTLATIETADIDAFLLANFRDKFTIRVGGYQTPGSVEPHGGWNWISGSPFTFTNWAQNEPDAIDNTLVWNMHGSGTWGDFEESSIFVGGFLVQYQSTLVNHVANIDLGDFADDSSVPVQVELFVDGQLVHTRNVNGGTVNVSTGLRGPVQMRFTASHWLDKVVSLNLGGSPSTVSINMVNGDVDSDNEVGAGDLSLMSGAFLSSTGDPNFLASADLDGDGEVGSADMSILSQNFLLSGDSL